MNLRRTSPVLTTLLATVLAGSAHAQSGLAVTASLGTTGAGLHLVVPMESDVNGRFGANFLRHGFDKRSGDIDYDADATLRSVDVLFDWYVVPGSPFRLTGGIMYNGNEVTGHARAGGDGYYHLGGRRYSAATVGSLDAQVDFQKAAPYIGIGWGNALAAERGWGVQADLGTFYQGNAHVKLGNTGCRAERVTCIVFASDIAAEEARLKEELSEHKFYPVLRASLSYRF